MSKAAARAGDGGMLLDCTENEFTTEGTEKHRGWKRWFWCKVPNAGCARGTDEGVRPHTCAWLRLRGTAEARCPYVGD